MRLATIEGSQGGVARRARQAPPSPALISGALLTIGILGLTLPTLFSLAQTSWRSDQGAHGPFVLFIALWLFWRAGPPASARPGPASLGALGLVPALILYALGRNYGILIFETAGLYLSLIAIIFLRWGRTGLGHYWFPILFLGFLLPVPESFVAQATQPLKLWISDSVVALLHQLGYPVGRSGVSIQVAQYSLLVEDACAGLNSLLGLTAVGLLYVHLARNAGKLHSALLCAAIIPIAIAANFLRVVILVLLTVYSGDRVAQGFSHDLAGITMFAIALAGMFAVDAGIAAVLPRDRRE